MKSNHVGSHVYGTEYEIWDDFGPVGNTEINNLAMKVLMYSSDR